MVELARAFFDAGGTVESLIPRRVRGEWTPDQRHHAQVFRNQLEHLRPPISGVGASESRFRARYMAYALDGALDRNQHGLLARDADHEIVGVASWESHGLARFTEVLWLGTTGEFRGSGAALMAAAALASLADGLPQLVVLHALSSARGFYQKIGFTLSPELDTMSLSVRAVSAVRQHLAGRLDGADRSAPGLT